MPDGLRRFSRGLEPLGLTHAHATALAAILRLTDVAARTGFEASTVSHLVRD